MKNIFIKAQSYKTLFQNFLSLSFLQFFNYLFPVITLPYVVRVLGPEKYGLVNFAAAFIGYFITISEYGFNLSAVRQISVNRNDQQKVNKIFISVLASKFFLAAVSFILFIIIVLSLEKFRSEFWLYVITFGSVLSTILFPFWLFQGLERMKYIPIIQVIPKIAGVILIFWLIKSQGDYLIFALINTGVLIVSGIAGLIAAVKVFSFRLAVPSFDDIMFQLKDGLNLFKSNLAINLYTNSNAFILGLLTNNEVVGYYSAADKIRLFFQSLLAPVSQSVFPFVNYLLKESKEKLLLFNKQLLKYQSVAGFSISLIIFINAELIINLALGENYNESVIILKLICWLPFIIYLSNIYGIQTMLPLGFDREFFYIVAIAAFINIILAFILVPYLQGIGISIAVLSTEIFVSTSMIIFLLKKKERLL
ncbi:MAG: flippase [Ignavibacterium sp.]|nr:flippase [Ignavibacterium sp.]